MITSPSVNILSPPFNRTGHCRGKKENPAEDFLIAL
jgi:hypothetical protein